MAFLKKVFKCCFFITSVAGVDLETRYYRMQPCRAVGAQLVVQTMSVVRTWEFDQERFCTV